MLLTFTARSVQWLWMMPCVISAGNSVGWLRPPPPFPWHPPGTSNAAPITTANQQFFLAGEPTGPGS